MASKESLFQKLIQNPQMMNITAQMYNSMNPENQMKFLSRPNFRKFIAAQSTTGAPDFKQGSIDEAAFLSGLQDGSAHMKLPNGETIDTVGQELSRLMTGGDNGDPGNLGDLGALALGATKAHPFKAAGLLGLGAGNIGGLMDNKKFGGQLGGLALGGLGASAFASGNPYLAAMLTMGSGELGALFDKLRAKKEQEQVQPYYGGR